MTIRDLKIVYIINKNTGRRYEVIYDKNRQLIWCSYVTLEWLKAKNFELEVRDEPIIRTTDGESKKG